MSRVPDDNHSKREQTVHRRMRGITRWTAVLAVVAAGLPAAASAAPKYTDNYDDNPDPLAPSTVFVNDNTAATIQPGETYTPNGAGSCAKTGTSRDMDHTLWWRVTGTGGPIVLSTRGSSFDSLLAVYQTTGTPSTTNYVDCSDNGTGDDALLRLNTTAGANYLVQAGTCANYFNTGAGDWFDCGSNPGELRISAVTNDQRAYADTATSGARANVGAITDPGELTNCKGTDYGSTVWFKYSVTKPGWLTVEASRFDLVLALYRGSETAPVLCSQDSRPDNPLIESFRQYVSPGDYYIQVGGKDFGSFNAEDNFTYETSFEEDLDLDKDGSNRPEDCDDGNAGIRPGKPDIAHNNIDEDCVGGDNKDEDGDKHNADFAGGDDCDDKKSNINPGVADEPNNGIDENCDKADKPARLGTTPQVAFRSRPFLNGVVFGTMYIRALRKGYRVEIRCRRSSSCPRRYRKTIRSGRSIAFQKFRAKAFKTGATIEIFVTKPGNVIGFYKSYTVRGTKNPKQRVCELNPGSRRPVRC